MRLHHSGHSVYKTEYHVTWITKYRRRILNPGVVEYLNRLFPKLLKQVPGVEIIEKNILVDHLHLVMVIPPKYAVSDVIGMMKQTTAKHLRRRFEFLSQVYWKEQIVWSPGYFVSTVGINEKQILEYVKWQQNQDSGQAKLALS